MRPILLSGYESATHLLRYDPGTGRGEEVRASDLSGAVPSSRGFYVSVEGQLIGVYATPGGPVCFWNEERYPMSDPRFGLVHEAEGAEHVLRLLWDGRERHRIRYPRRSAWGYDNWSEEEESADFLLWLSRQLGSPQFYQFNTTPAGEGS